MFNQDYQDKTEPASPRKKEESRKRGYVPLSTELNFAFVLLSFFLVLACLFFPLLTITKEVFKNNFNKIISPDLSLQSFQSLYYNWSTYFFKIILPLALLPIIPGILSHLLQSNFLLTFETPFSSRGRFNSSESAGLSSRFSRLLSKMTLYEGIKFSVKFTLLGLIGFLLIKNELPNLATLSDRNSVELVSYFSSVLFKLGLGIVGIYLVLGVGDYLFQRWQFQKEIRMTRQEAIKELREEEGSPEVKGAFRDLIRERR
ncbi:MAG TPA: EscU/YscU/HrcU family type III secretion system export apparatus switch protein [Terriglobales bacterium]|nr:EscU/YscU/HrcU family type III secretion system export apparatus switch protein [Terriglobales bacterium]